MKLVIKIMEKTVANQTKGYRLFVGMNGMQDSNTQLIFLAGELRYKVAKNNIVT